MIKEMVSPHKGKIAVGTLIAIGAFVVPHVQGVVKWSQKTDENIKLIKTMAKENQKAIKVLQKCEHDFNADMAVVKNEIENIKEDMEKP